MLELKKIGLLLRDEEQEYPLEEIHKVFAGRGIDLILLDQMVAIPDDVNLVMAMEGMARHCMRSTAFPIVRCWPSTLAK